MDKSEIWLREKNELVYVPVNSEFSELLDDRAIAKWQKLINLVAEILNVKAGLIMRITEENMEVFLRSENEGNPYPADSKDKLGHGLYCETVIGKDKELFIENALISEVWKDNPDVKLDMISYIGLPIKNPDGSFFGTICALDERAMVKSKKYLVLLEQFRESIEMDLQMILKNRCITELTYTDELTGLDNRRRMNEYLQSAQEDINRNLMHVSLALIDLDRLKEVNDQLGHFEGDTVLKIFGNILRNRLRKTDRVARIGGDEFVVLCRGTDIEGLTMLLKDIRRQFEANSFIRETGVSFSFGMASTSEQEKDVFEILKQADRNMYRQKHEDTF